MRLPLLFVLCWSALLWAEDPQRVLFIGNSYTGVNKLPEVFLEVVKSAGKKAPEVKAATPGGRTLQNQLGLAASMKLIDEGNWDVVVLQGHSQEAARAEQEPAIAAEFTQSAAELCGRVRAKSPKVQIYFYQTWARHPDFWKTDKKATAVGANPQEMLERIRKWYGKVALDNQATVVPCGEAWALNYAAPNALRLHTKDNSHPELSGTYLNAVIFYGKIYGVKTPDIGWTGTLTPEVARQMRGYAAKVLK